MKIQSWRWTTLTRGALAQNKWKFDQIFHKLKRKKSAHCCEEVEHKSEIQEHWEEVASLQAKKSKFRNVKEKMKAI